MDDRHKSQEDLLEELHTLRARVAAMEAQEKVWDRVEIAYRQRHSELESLLETSHDLSSVLAAEDLIPLIAERVTQLLASDECVLFELQPDGETLRAILALGPKSDQIIGATMHRDDGLTGIAIASGDPLVVNDAHHDPRSVLIPPPPEETPRAHVMIAPLAVRGRVIGAMVLNRVPGLPFTENDLRLFTAFAQQVAVAIENARLYMAVQQHAEEMEQRVNERTAELKQQKDEVEAILNSVADGLLITDQHGVIMAVNPALERMTGFAAVDLVGLSTRAMQTGALLTPQRVDAIWEEARQGGQVRIELPIRRRDGTTFDADLNIAPLLQLPGTVRGFVVVLRDVTAIKEVQRMKDDFVSNVTHELRTPITSLKLRYHLLQASPDRLHEHISVLRRETDRLARIIDDLLTLSRIDQGRITFERAWLDLNVLVQQYVVDRQPVAQARDLTLALGALPDLPSIFVDAGLLGQAFSIVLTNALNYTPPGGRVEVSTAVRDTGQQRWAGVTVCDSGPGVTDDDHEQLFTRFFRGSAAQNSGVSGTGLGLAIADQIVKRHGGVIEVGNVDAPEQGAKFTIWLPVHTSGGG